MTDEHQAVPHDKDRHSLAVDTGTYERWHGFPVEFAGSFKPEAEEGWASYPAEREAVAELMRDREHPNLDETRRS